MTKRSSKVYIASTGIITSIGKDTSENRDSLSLLKAGISMPSILQTIHQLPIGEIKLTNQELSDLVNKRFGEFHINKSINKPLPRTSLLSLLATQEAWLPLMKKAEGLKIAFISANTVGGMDLTEKFYTSYLENEKNVDFNNIRSHECGSITEIVVDQMELNCWNTTISTACSSSANSIMMGCRMIEHGHFDLVIAGGADSLSKFTLNGFNSLMILDKGLNTPFDKNRKGLNLGEGAAYLILGNKKALHQLEIEPKVYVSGYANANDAHHQTASSPEGRGNKLAMEKALNKASIPPELIDYINLHGTGTENNDSSEAAAIQELFGAEIPLNSSTKAYTGHTLGASGAVEAVYSYLSIMEQKVWPNLRFKNKMDHVHWKPTTKLTTKKINHVLSNSFGFGGNCSALIFSKEEN